MRLLVFDHSVKYGLALVWALCVLWQYWFRSFKFGGYKIGLDFYLKVNRFKGSFKEPINAFRNDNQIFFWNCLFFSQKSMEFCFSHRGMNIRGKNWLLWKGPSVCCLICICNYDLDLFSTLKWPSELQFFERWIYIWWKNGQKWSYKGHI